jgi:hypothetical protein
VVNIRLIPGNSAPLSRGPAQNAVINSLAMIRDRAISELITAPPSGITKFGLWRTGDKKYTSPGLFEMRKAIAELGHKNTLFNIAIDKETLYLGLITLKNNERSNHLDIHAPFNSGHKFTGNTEISNTGAVHIMISPTNSLIYSLGQDYRGAMFDGSIRIARFFVKSGFPAWTRMHSSMQFDLHCLTKPPYTPSPIVTISDLAHKALSGEINGTDIPATGS